MRIGSGELQVLFPGSAAIFADAAQLDLCEAKGGCRVSDLVIAETPVAYDRLRPS